MEQEAGRSPAMQGRAATPSEPSQLHVSGEAGIPNAGGFPYLTLGEIDDSGRIYTTCGWSEHGPAWVIAKQIPPTVGYGWIETGKSAPFMGYTIYELVRP